MKQLVSVLLLVSVLVSVTAMADITVQSRSKDFYIDLSTRMPKVSGLTVHTGKVVDAEPSDWGYMSDNGVLMVNADYVGIIKARHYVWSVKDGQKTLAQKKTFTVNVAPQKVTITKAFQIGEGAVQVRFKAVPGADFYRVAIGKGNKVLRTRDTFKLSKDFNGLEKGVYWVMVCAITDVYGTELSSYASERVKVTVK